MRNFLFSCVSLFLLFSSCSDKNSPVLDSFGNKLESTENIFNVNETYWLGDIKLLKSNNLPVTGYIEYFNEKDGFLESRGYFINGKEEGKDICYFKDGSISLRRYYKNGELDGNYERFYANGRQAESCEYEKGELNGRSVSWYENGQIRDVNNYENGLRKGWQKTYLENGELLYEVNLVNGNGLISYKIPRTDILVNQEYREGKMIKPDNGVMLSGLGLNRDLIKHGNLLFETNFLNGEKSSQKQKRIFSNMLIGEMYFKDGLLHGMYKRWYDNGQLKEEGENKFNNKHGLWQFWHENGKLQEISKYEFGILISKKCWDESGKKIECECYNNNGYKIPCP